MHLGTVIPEQTVVMDSLFCRAYQHVMWPWQPDSADIPGSGMSIPKQSTARITDSAP